MTGSDDGEGTFLGRWSRLKRSAVRQDAPKSEPAPEPAPPAAAEAEAEPNDAELLRRLGLPDPETLGPGDDFSRFMAAAVPRRLRNMALRRLWLSDPVLANLDGLNDYEEDYTDAAKVVAGLKTAYEVGRGFLQKAGSDAGDEETSEPAAEPETATGPEAAREAAPGEGGDGPPDDDASPDERLAEAPTARRKRMRFRQVEE